jgi:branched-subunit amino acid aminotransferase/4-amino-4-deoxychorismate lyase
MQAEELDVGLFVDAEDYILEGPNANFGMITEDNVFVTPPFDNILAGITVQRLMELIPGEHERFPSDVLVHKIEQRKIHVEEVYKAKEAFLIGSNTLVTAITSLNGQDIADGKPGASSIAFANMLENDQLPREDSPVHIEVPYGYITGMRGQLI